MVADSAWPPLTRRRPRNGAFGGAIHDPVVELAALDHLDEPRALDLAARGLGDGACAHEQDTRGPVAALLVHGLTISRTRPWYSSGGAPSPRTSATTCRRWV